MSTFDVTLLLRLCNLLFRRVSLVGLACDKMYQALPLLKPCGLGTRLTSIVVVRVVAADSRNQLVLCGQLYVADCKDEGNTLKPYLPEKM